jgi:peptidoglycan/LPS O-acetylase OafA/YrhL
MATAVAVRLLAPDTQWKDGGWQIVASAFYAQNWLLASSSVDYLAADDAPSPVQHFWSLSVEEQFYLAWPLLIGAAAWWASRKLRNTRATAAVVVLGVIAVSLAISVYVTAVDPGPAYFITPTRMWELAFGGLVAVLPASTRHMPSSAARSIIAWLGIGGILLAGFTYTGSTPFPGYTALLPVAGTALVLWANAESRYSPAPLLGLRPVQYLGDISYSVYLWHWPLIALLPALSGPLGPLDILVIVVATLVLAGLSKKFVEDRFRFSKAVQGAKPAYRFAAVGMVVLLLAGGGLAAESHLRTAAAASKAAAAEAQGGPCFGAAAIARGFDACPPDDTAPLVPEPALAKDDKSDAYADDCWSNQPFTGRPVCTYGDGPTKVALVGNSHAGHWLPALQRIAEERGWTISTYLVSRCNPSDARQQFDTPEMSQNCHDYGQWVLEETAHGQFDMIITSERQSVRAENASWEQTADLAQQGYASYLGKWVAAGTPVAVIRDTPYPGQEVSNIPDCLAENPSNRSACAGTPETWHWMDPLADAAAAAQSPKIGVVNMQRYFCSEDTCPAAIGGVVAYFDGSHITATYARSLSPYLAKELDALDLK